MGERFFFFFFSPPVARRGARGGSRSRMETSPGRAGSPPDAFDDGRSELTTKNLRPRSEEPWGCFRPLIVREGASSRRRRLAKDAGGAISPPSEQTYHRAAWPRKGGPTFRAGPAARESGVGPGEAKARVGAGRTTAGGHAMRIRFFTPQAGSNSHRRRTKRRGEAAPSGGGPSAT